MAIDREGPPEESPSYFEALGRAIQALRAERGLSRADLAERAGLSYSYLSEIETGKKVGTSSKVLFAIAKALDVTVGELIGTAEERVLPTMLEWSTPPASESRDFAAPSARANASPERGTARSWFRGGNRLREVRGAEDGEPSAPKEASRARALQEFAEILPNLSPADLALVLDFARRLRR